MANKIKPVLKLWCLPQIPEDNLVALHKDLVAAAVSVKELKLKSERDLIVLFPSDMMKHGLGSELLVEYEHSNEASGEDFDILAAKLGNAVKRHRPQAFIQVNVRPGQPDYEQHSWTSKLSGTPKLIEKVISVAERKQPSLDQMVREKCHCQDNAIDHKGPCGYCNDAGFNRLVITEGKRIMRLTEPAEFQAAADVYVAAHG